MSRTAGSIECGLVSSWSTASCSGGGIALSGIVAGAVIVIEWINRGFGVLAEERLAVLAATLIIVGIQIFFSSFLLSILGLRRRDPRAGFSVDCAIA